MMASSAVVLFQAGSGLACLLFLLRAGLSHKSLLFFLARLFRLIEDRTQSFQTFNIPRHDADSLAENPLHRKAATYIASLSSAEDSDHTNLLSSTLRSNDFFTQLAPGQTVHDCYLESRLSWTVDPSRGLLLRLRRQDRHRVLRPYLQHVEKAAEEIEIRRKEIRLYTNSASQAWRGVPMMMHPATLDTLAMDQELKSRVKADLELFLKGRAYYARLGRVWKRSYLLHGLPGTGKSSFAAAMARFLCYDVYDLDLSLVPDSAVLRSLLLGTTPRSVVLVEDLDLYYARALMLDFMDGVFSCCGEERVMIYTVSGGKAEALEGDPAVMRPGRVDARIFFPLCDFAAFKTMASSYLGVTEHKLYGQVEEGFQAGARLSPAELGEIMLANRSSPSRAIRTVIGALHHHRTGSLERLVRARDELAERDTARKDPSGNDLRKLYSFIRLRSGNRRERKLPLGVAAAAVGFDEKPA